MPKIVKSRPILIINKMKNRILPLLLTLVCCSAVAQELLNPSFTFSHKKTSYITLTDGTEIQGTIKDLDREKGLIEEVKIKDGNGKKHKLKPEDIKFMYLPPSGFDKLTKKLDTALDVQKWEDGALDRERLNLGYIYFELADVKIKKKTKKLLMQLLNPSFSKNIKVYHDPLAKQSMSIGVGPLTVAGGNEKSYYIAKGNEAAFRLKKKDYKDEFDPLWSSCPNLIKDFPLKKWNDLTKHVLSYSECTD